MERDPCCTIGEYLLLDWVNVSKGSFISKAVHMSTQKMVTVKLLDKHSFRSRDLFMNKLHHNNGCFSTNISILKNLDHDNVVKVLEGLLLNQSIPVSGGGDPFQLRYVVVMDCCYGSDLQQWLSELQDLGHSSQLNIFSQMVDGLNYLHKQNLFHGRIQPSNVWVQGGRPMLHGFGLGNSYEGWNLEGEQWFYIAPECCAYMKGFSHPRGKKSDVYSLGILLVQLHSRDHEYGLWNLWKLSNYSSPFAKLPDQHCLTNFMKRLVYLMTNPVYDLRIDVQLVKDMLNNEMDLM